MLFVEYQCVTDEENTASCTLCMKNEVGSHINLALSKMCLSHTQIKDILRARGFSPIFFPLLAHLMTFLYQFHPSKRIRPVRIEVSSMVDINK